MLRGKQASEENAPAQAQVAGERERADQTAGEPAAPDPREAMSSTAPADAQLASLSPADVIRLAPFTELPPPSTSDMTGSDMLTDLFAKVTAVAQADPFTETKRKSAFLADPAALTPERAECAFAQTAVLIDLDPGDAEAPLDDGIGAPERLVRVLATLRAQEVAVLWLSRHTAVRAGAVRRTLLRTGLDPRGTDPLYLVRYADESKATRRADAAKDFCVVAILGDEKRDFDELFAFLKEENAALGLESLIGEAWFLAPDPILSPPEEG